MQLSAVRQSNSPLACPPLPFTVEAGDEYVSLLGFVFTLRWSLSVLVCGVEMAAKTAPPCRDRTDSTRLTDTVGWAVVRC